MTIETRAYARAGFLGNPSDGYFGKTISIIIKNFGAGVSLQPASEFRIEAHDWDLNAYRDMDELVERVNLYGYYGGDRLIKATIKKFHEYCRSNDIPLEKKNCSIRYHSEIPRQVGLGGSSAIVTATIRALMQFYEVDIPINVLPSLTLDAEKGELGINAGLQDRVVQAYEGCLYMDFDRDVMEKTNCGMYEPLDPALLPPLFVAYKTRLGKVSGHALNEIRVGYDRGDKRVIDTLGRIAELAEKGKQALLQRNPDLLHELMNENFNLRSTIQTISDSNHEMVRTARNCGAAAKFSGSGGSVIGMYRDDDMLARLTEAFAGIDATVIKPIVTERDSS
jgi:glucuronokinase